MDIDQVNVAVAILGHGVKRVLILF